MYTIDLETRELFEKVKKQYYDKFGQELPTDSEEFAKLAVNDDHKITDEGLQALSKYIDKISNPIPPVDENLIF